MGLERGEQHGERWCWQAEAALPPIGSALRNPALQPCHTTPDLQELQPPLLLQQVGRLPGCRQQLAQRRDFPCRQCHDCNLWGLLEWLAMFGASKCASWPCKCGA